MKKYEYIPGHFYVRSLTETIFYYRSVMYHIVISKRTNHTTVRISRKEFPTNKLKDLLSKRHYREL